MVDQGSSSTRRTFSETSEEQVSSKMEKTQISPPERMRRRTIKDDLKVKYTGDDMDKRGTKGQPMTVKANMFRISCRQGAEIHMYAAIMEPEIRSRRLKDIIIKNCNLGMYHYNLNCVFLPNRQEVVIFFALLGGYFWIYCLDAWIFLGFNIFLKRFCLKILFLVRL